MTFVNIPRHENSFLSDEKTKGNANMSNTMCLTLVFLKAMKMLIKFFLEILGSYKNKLKK